MSTAQVTELGPNLFSDQVRLGHSLPDLSVSPVAGGRESSSFLLPFPEPLVRARFLGRPQRFLAEMRLEDGSTTLAYCPNPGAMESGLPRGAPALLWDSGSEERKRRYTWKAVRKRRVWIGVDTGDANPLVEEALRRGLVPGFSRVESLCREVVTGYGTRADLVTAGDGGECFIEVKASAVVVDGVARYPNCRTPRGVRQLDALTKKAQQGVRAALVFVIPREDAEELVVTPERDAEYAEAFCRALGAGLSVVALGAKVSPKGLEVQRVLPVRFGEGEGPVSIERRTLNAEGG